MKEQAIKKFASLQTYEYDLGLSLETESESILNPWLDETGRFTVDPGITYGGAFLAWLDQLADCEYLVLAVLFADEVKKAVNSKKYMNEIVQKNTESDYQGACASHDYIDANMCMLKAYEFMTGKTANFQNEYTINLMNSAWNVAKNSHFFS